MATGDDVPRPSTAREAQAWAEVGRTEVGPLLARFLTLVLLAGAPIAQARADDKPYSITFGLASPIIASSSNHAYARGGSSMPNASA